MTGTATVAFCVRGVCTIAAVIVGASITAHGEIYVSAYVGGARTRTANIALDQPGTGTRVVFERVQFSGRSLQSPVYYGYRAGYYVISHFALEAEFIHLKIYADVEQPVTVRGTIEGVPVQQRSPMSRFVQQFEVSHGLNLVLVNAVIRRSLLRGHGPGRSRLSFVARAGVGPTIPRPEIVAFGRAGGRYQLGPVATQGAAGLEARLWRGLRVLTEYKYTFTPTSFDIPDGRASVHVHSHHLVTGLAVHF